MKQILPHQMKAKSNERKILTGFRIDPNLKKVSMLAASKENRSLANYIENLIRKDLETKGLIRSEP